MKPSEAILWIYSIGIEYGVSPEDARCIFEQFLGEYYEALEEAIPHKEVKEFINTVGDKEVRNKNNI
jgi:hypothetical protein